MVKAYLISVKGILIDIKNGTYSIIYMLVHSLQVAAWYYICYRKNTRKFI